PSDGAGRAPAPPPHGRGTARLGPAVPAPPPDPPPHEIVPPQPQARRLGAERALVRRGGIEHGARRLGGLGAEDAGRGMLEAVAAPGDGRLLREGAPPSPLGQPPPGFSRGPPNPKQLVAPP